MEELTVDEVKRILDKKEKIVLLDVRTAAEYANTHIPGSVLIPLDEISEKVHKKIPDKKTKIIAYCLSGSRSSVVAEALARLGYHHVFSMSHGLLAWRIKKYPLEK